MTLFQGAAFPMKLYPWLSATPEGRMAVVDAAVLEGRGVDRRNGGVELSVEVRVRPSRRYVDPVAGPGELERIHARRAHVAAEPKDERAARLAPDRIHGREWVAPPEPVGIAGCSIFPSCPGCSGAAGGSAVRGSSRPGRSPAASGSGCPTTRPNCCRCPRTASCWAASTAAREEARPGSDDRAGSGLRETARR